MKPAQEWLIYGPLSWNETNIPANSVELRFQIPQRKWTISAPFGGSNSQAMQMSNGISGHFAYRVTKRKLRLTDKWRAVCAERCMHGPEGGVGKHDL
jgi:hypothetical protein